MGSSSATFFLLVTRVANRQASAVEVATSYRPALDTSIPVSSHTTDWYSKVDCRVPWLISGWYGV